MRTLGAAAVAALLAVVAGAQPTAVPEELTRVRQQVEELEVRLKQIESRQADLRDERGRLEAQLALAEARVREAEVERAALAQDEAVAAREAAAAQVAVEQAVERLRSQLTVLAVLGRAGMTPLVLRAVAGGEDISRRVTVALLLAREQRRQRDEVAALADRRAGALAALSQRREELQAATARTLTRRVELQATRERVIADLGRLERERRSGAAELASALEAEGRLERLWGVVVQEQESPIGDARLLRGGLPWPVTTYRVVRRFGEVRDPRYGTRTVSNGLAFAVAPGARVHAIAAGKVAYAQFFKGYGNLVIVQHGGQVFSLYAQLSSILAAAGQKVVMGEEVGIAGPDPAGEGNFYLEVRVGQDAQDPLAWLKPAGR